MNARSAALTRAAGTALCIFAALTILGWAFELDALRSWLTGAVAMNPMTALCFGAIGAALLRVAGPSGSLRDPLLLSLVALVVLAAASRVVAYAGGPDAGLDGFLFADALARFDPPNRMAPNTAAAFGAVAVGLALVLSRAERTSMAGQLLALTAGIVGLITLCGYLFGIAGLMGPRYFIPMSLPTAIGFAVASIGVLAARSDEGLVGRALAPTLGGQTFRRIAPPAVLLPPVLTWLATLGARAGFYDAALSVSIGVIMGTLLFVMLLGMNARAIDRADLVRAEAERDTRALVRDLRRKSAELAAANEELDSFSYSVSHDLRAPLRSITSFSQILLEDHHAQLDEEGRSHLGRIVRAGARMSLLIDDLIELSRASRGELVRAEVDVTALAHDVVEELQQAEPQRDVEVTLERGLEVWADPRLLRIVLVNLIGNAWKYTSKVEHARIEFGALARAGSGGANRAAQPGSAEPGSVAVVDAGPIVFFVQDNGAGFDMQNADRLFAPFQRLHRADEFSGSGVGLATVRRVINRHGGRIWAESAPGAGATFFFTLNPTHDR